MNLRMNPPRSGLRLSDRILEAFDLACDQGELEIAELLFRSYEMVLTRGAGPVLDRRNSIEEIHRASLRLDGLRTALREGKLVRAFTPS